MTEEAQDRMGELFRQVRIRRELPSFLEAVGGAIDMAVETGAVLPLDASDQMQHDISLRISEGLQLTDSREHIQLPRSEQETFDEKVNMLTGQFGEENIILSLGHFGHLPLLKLPASLIHHHFHHLWSIGDTVTISSTDMARGFMADSYPDDEELGFEIVSWGLN